MPKIPQGKSICVHCKSYWKGEIFDIHIKLYRDAVVSKTLSSNFMHNLGKNV
jgi:hypothetical protein